MTPPPLPTDTTRAVTRERFRLLAIGYHISGAIGVISVSFLIFHFIFFTVFSFLPESTWNSPKCGGAVCPQSPASTATPASHAARKGRKAERGHRGETDAAKKPDKFPAIIFRVLAAVIGVVIFLGWTLGALTIYAGRCISKRQNRPFVLVMAGLNCIWIPYGTLLGIATFITLSTPDAKEEFGLHA